MEAASHLLPTERVFAYLDDLHVLTTQAREREAFQTIASAVERDAGVQTYFRGAARSAWRARWSAMLGVAQQTALAASLASYVPGTLDGCVCDAPPLGDIWLIG